VGFDASDTMIEDMKNGVIDALVVQDPFKMGFESVETLVQKLNGQTPPRKIDLPATLVRRQDLDKPDIHALLYPDVKKYVK
jgi:ribose transport system substrate-binding protein